MNYAKIEERGSAACKVVEAAWEQICEIVPRTPPAVIVLLASGLRRKRRGHFARSCWMHDDKAQAHEVAISPDLFQWPEELLATLVHEAVHARLFAQGGSAGCSNDGNYHNTDFRDCCQSLGLDCQVYNGRRGWCLTRWPDSGVPAPFQGVLTLLAQTIPLGTEGSRPSRVAGRALPKSGHARLVCSCKRSIYVNRSVLAQGGIHCVFCKSAFRP